MPKTTIRELKLSKLLDEVICLDAFSKNVGFAELIQMNPFVEEAYREIAMTQKLASEDGVEYPITLALAKYLRKEGLFEDED